MISDHQSLYNGVMLVIILVMGVLAALLFAWQIQVLSGRAMPNPDGTFDDWHEQKILYGIAIADIVISCPATFIGVIMVLTGKGRAGHHLFLLLSFWFVWINTATTVTSLRFENPNITLEWFIVFPLGALLGLTYMLLRVVANRNEVHRYESLW